MKVPFKFSIRGLDELVSGSSSVSHADEVSHPWTGAIVGPDGCGKSILSLQLASVYWHDHATKYPQTRILYVSTDLSYPQAHAQWLNFGFDYPKDRYLAIEAAYRRPSAVAFDPSTRIGPKCRLIPLNPRNDQAIERFTAAEGDNAVYFLDLHSQTTGDDWGYVCKLLGLIGRRGDSDHRHLVILDAVEGLESLVGEIDAFGLRRSRRSRVAQIIRNANEANAHLLVVVEEARSNTRLPEQFVTDLVLRLRTRRKDAFSQRTIEVEKCRATPHARGEHELDIRRGSGTTTGNKPHLDDPEVSWSSATVDGNVVKRFLSHVHVTKSLHLWNQEVREEIATIPVLIGAPSFLKLPILTQMLAPIGKGIDADPTTRIEGSFSFVLGDAGTHKSVLADHFLASAFVKGESEFIATQGVSVLVTTGLTDATGLARRLATHLFESGVQPAGMAYSTAENFQADIAEQVICRRLAVRRMSSASLLEVIESCVREAQRRIGVDWSLRGIEERRDQSYRIRFVLDDWNQLLSMHPNFADDSLLVQSMLSLLKREGLSSLIVSTQPGQPTLPETALARNDLRKLDENQIFTWSVPFFGERRVAITAYPAHAAKDRPVIHELDVSSASSIGARINRRFALYTDIDRGAPKRVPLLVRLYEGNHPSAVDLQEKPAYARMLHDTLAQVFPHSTANAGIISFEPCTSYDSMFSFADNLDDSQLDHSLIFQIDEFWSIGKSSLARMTDYWGGIVATLGPLGNFISEKDEDVFTMLQPHRMEDRSREPSGDIDLTPRITSRQRDKPNQYKRSEMFIARDDGGPRVMDGNEIDRIPYLWDFGLILTHRDTWYRYRCDDIGIKKGESTWKVKDVWNALCLPEAELEGDVTCEYVPWEVFLTACQHISTRENLTPFSFDLSTPESLHCLILELWASIEWALAGKSGIDPSLETLHNRQADSKHSLRDLFERNPMSLFLAFQWLAHSCPELRGIDVPGDRMNRSCLPLCSREWYHTASAIMKRAGSENDLEVLALPGRFSCRGDWNLAVAKGSRSALLAQHAADLLTSRRLNLLRLQDGIGLPVRDIAPDFEIGNLVTALTSRQSKNNWRRRSVTYRDLCYLGSLENKSTRDFEFYWLWRSQIRHYDRSVFYWREWIAQMLSEQHKWVIHETKLLLTQEKALEPYKRVHAKSATWESEAKAFEIDGTAVDYFQYFLSRLRTLCATLRG